MANNVITTAQLFALLRNEEVNLEDGSVVFDGNRSASSINIRYEAPDGTARWVSVSAEFINEPRWRLA